MIKIIALIKRRVDIPRREFRRHYEYQHVPLALTVLEGYVRNHVQARVPEDAGADELTFDCLTMFWYRNEAHLNSTIEVLSGTQGTSVAADEQTFMDKSANRFFQVEEQGESTAPWEKGFTALTHDSVKIIGLIPAAEAQVFREELLAGGLLKGVPGLLTWVNNHVPGQAGGAVGEFEEIVELWFTDQSASQASTNPALETLLQRMPTAVFVEVCAVADVANPEPADVAL